ncbi:MAG: hypothetical protein IT437_08295 [Phycisphaerales bacterium]|nr:hypothetical protein [Phycisphaerales bacterium]
MNPALGLLGLLGLGGSRHAPKVDPARASVGAEFASLLERARKGDLSSGLPVSIARGSPIELTPEQLARVAAATDRAEARGGTRALVLVDGMALRVDVAARQVLERVDLASGLALTGIDAFVTAPDNPEDGPVPLPGSATAAMNASLLRTLSHVDDDPAIQGGVRRPA